MTHLAQIDPLTATTNQLRGMLAEERITLRDVARFTRTGYPYLSTMLNREQAVIPDLTAEVLDAVAKVKAERDSA